MQTIPTSSDLLVEKRWIHWPVYWSAIVVGALTALALVLLVGLFGLAFGAHVVGPSRLVLDWKTLAWSGLIFNVCGIFFAFVGGGWVAAKVAGILRTETAMAHGAIVWLVTIPLLVFFSAQGASTYMGGWFGGLSPQHPAWAQTSEPTPLTSPGDSAKAQTTQELNAAKITRNTAIGAAAAMLLGLMGAAIGAWMACGEPMTLTYWRHREPLREHMIVS